MPPSQLKRLKSSLREQGVIGPQQSKKQKKENARNGYNHDKRLAKNVALSGIREKFNPFEFVLPGRRPKWASTTIDGNSGHKAPRRPGLKASQEKEAYSLLHQDDRNNRHKVGGIIDKRFGENDPSMTLEAKMLERYTRAQLKGKGKASAFDLEDEEPGELTHMGKSLSLDGPVIQDDFEEEDLSASESDGEHSARKRRRSDIEDTEEGGEESNEEELPQRKKSKQEVMKEVIAKSKLHKYERQAAKDDDDDLREELDKELPGIHALLRGIAPKPAPAPAPITDIPGMNPDRLALLQASEKPKLEKDYDVRLRQLAQDQRSKPTEKSKTEDQIILERAQKLQDLESRRLRRMQGVAEESDEESSKEETGQENGDYDEEEEDYGLGSGIKARPAMAELGFDDEDDFLIEDSLIGSDSELDPDTVSFEPADGGADDFVQGLLTKEEEERPEFLTGANAPIQEIDEPSKNGVNGDLPYNFECPQSHEQLLQVLRKVIILDLPTAIQRIRMMYDPKLRSENKAKLGKFAVALVDHISYIANQEQQPPFSVLEAVIRHIHSLAKTFAVEIANAFRHHLENISKSRPLALTPGDLVLFTAIGTIFPTSDHFHQVVTPAILSMTRYLGLKIPQNLSDYATGMYLCTLCIQYQRLSLRYVPEVMNFIENTLCALSPKKFALNPGNFPFHEPKTVIRITENQGIAKKLAFYDCLDQERSEEEQSELKIALMETCIRLLNAAANLWTELSAWDEIFEPVLVMMKHFGAKSCQSTFPASTRALISGLTEALSCQLQAARLKRRPLELHHHRPLAIKLAIPKFEESFNPDRHYDPDRERTEAAKLKKEYKREHKGAVRALRKDGRIIAAQQLREKRERDEAYEKNQKRLLAMIQGEEGAEQKAYEREKEWRKKGKK